MGKIINPNDRIGERRMMNCGQYAEIINYNNSDNIDVLFEDGYVAYHKCYCHFKNGKIKSRLSEMNRLGEEKVMNCGLKAKIIKYNNSQDIDIKFEDGFVHKNQCYSHFKNGRLESRLKYINRVGETRTMNNGEEVKLIKYETAKNISVQFENGYIIENIAYDSFVNGVLSSIYAPHIEGIGYLGNSKIHNDNGRIKKSYICWTNMIKRSCNRDFKEKHKTYANASSCKEWLCYEVFEDWYNDNYYEVSGEIMCLDKDILIKGNKMYSPNTCVFAPQSINALFVKTDSLRGTLPIGVQKNGNKYYARWYEKCVSNITPVVETIDEAFALYKENKERHIKSMADEYKDKIPQKLYEAMYRYEVEITD